MIVDIASGPRSSAMLGGKHSPDAEVSSCNPDRPDTLLLPYAGSARLGNVCVVASPPLVGAGSACRILGQHRALRHRQRDREVSCRAELKGERRPADAGAQT